MQVKLVNYISYVQILSYEKASLSHNSNRHAVQYKRPVNLATNMSRFTGLLFTLWFFLSLS